VPGSMGMAGEEARARRDFGKERTGKERRERERERERGKENACPAARKTVDS